MSVENSLRAIAVMGQEVGTITAQLRWPGRWGGATIV